MKAKIKKVDNGTADFYFAQPSGQQAWDVEVDGGNVQVRAESIRVDAGNGNGDYIRRETRELTVHVCPDGRAADYDTITAEIAAAAISAVRAWQTSQQ